MTTIYLATTNALAVVRQSGSDWRAEVRLTDVSPYCVSADPLRPEIVYVGTSGSGLWRTVDGGRRWRRAGSGIASDDVLSVAVSRLERTNGTAVVWAGTEPSALYRSEDGGETWVERTALRELPSAPTWSFPPRPWTSHVRWIAPDPVMAERIFVGIELGGVMRSLDGGLTWEDRKPESQYDAHTLRTHVSAPGRVYEAAGGGYAESLDGGASWQRHDDGLTRRYVWGLAIDPGDPATMLVSAAPGPRQAHGHPGEAAIYRREGDGPWQEVGDGLPPATGTRAYVLASNEAEPGVFYATTREAEIYRSTDSGKCWESLHVSWPQGYKAEDVGGLVVCEI